MGGGNGQKAKMARERNLEKQKNAGKDVDLNNFYVGFCRKPA
ncbi:hypothetical protein A2U01_0053198 [Trifolium medium]|uniref:Small EDRK-rich factor-like N-terminal domain-containing protein n=1 Tax=Trifolium medium TaxID=97028 RepID=A0A392R7Z6_9FABA|nr:hypothetical protein [Trifolium medium]